MTVVPLDWVCFIPHVVVGSYALQLLSDGSDGSCRMNSIHGVAGKSELRWWSLETSL